MERERQVIEITALGRRLKLGELYDYRYDCMFTDGNVTRWQMETEVEENFKELEHFNFENCDRLEHMSIDEHSQVSVVAGLIENFTGASKYLLDQPDPTKDSRTFVCRIKSKEEKLDIRKLISRNVSRLSTSTGREKKPEATHVVVGITYGAEAYCVFTQHVQDKADQETPEHITKNWSKLMTEFKESLKKKRNVTQFQKLFSEEEQNWFTRLNCRMYADLLAAKADRDYSIIDVYSHCLKFIEQTQKFNPRVSKAVPLTYRLCPLKLATSLVRGICEVVEYRDVNAELVARCCHIWTELEKIEGRAKSICSVRNKNCNSSLSQFLFVIAKYKELLKKSLNQSILNARSNPKDDDEKVKRVVDIAERHSLFNPSKLERWLRNSQEELELAEKMGNVTGIVLLQSKNQLMEKLMESFVKKYALVLCVPPLDEQVSKTLEAMQNYVDTHTELMALDDDKDGPAGDKDESLKMIQHKKKLVFAKMYELVHHVENNKQVESQVQFFITFDPINTRGDMCSYSVYKGSELLRANLDRLPQEPTGLQINHKASNNAPSSILVEWNYEQNVDYPCHFLVQFRLKGQSDESWIQRRTIKPGETQTVIMLDERQSVMEIRVAADTCIGRSKFSNIIVTDIPHNDGKDLKRSESQPSESSNARVNITEKQMKPHAKLTASVKASIPNKSIRMTPNEIEAQPQPSTASNSLQLDPNKGKLLDPPTTELKWSPPVNKEKSSMRGECKRTLFTSKSESQTSESLNARVNIAEKQTKPQAKLTARVKASIRTTPNEIKAQQLQPPIGLRVELVDPSTAELKWSPPVNMDKINFVYRVRYWESVGNASLGKVLDVSSNELGCYLKQLQPDTPYSIYIATIADNSQQMSLPSEIIHLKTPSKQIRFAEKLLKSCNKIENRNGKDLYSVPLKPMSGTEQTSAKRFVFDHQRDNQQINNRMNHRTILVVGATGSGKTTWINAMINYIFDVHWDDSFRFQLVQEQIVGRSQIDSQTSRITAYDIHHVEGFRIPYSLTIVDTPGYGDTKGLDRDKEITEMIRIFFEEKGGIQELDVVGFFVQASLPRLTPTQGYIFDSILAIFGKDIRENIDFLLTFADSQDPPVLSAIADINLTNLNDPTTGKAPYHKFNNIGFFCSNRSTGDSDSKFNKYFWKMGMENFEKFFNAVATMTTKSLSLTKQVLDERKQLEATVDGLQPLIQTGLSKMEEMRKTKELIIDCQAQIDANQDVDIQMDVTVPQIERIPTGVYLTNCSKCYVTCHYPCTIPNDGDKAKCKAMSYFTWKKENRTCRICPGKCHWSLHSNQTYKWEYVKQKKSTSSSVIKQKYELELKKKLTAEELIKELQKDIDDNDKAVLERVDTVSRSIKRLEEIALRPNPFSTPLYIDLIIDAEQQEKREGFQGRIESLKKLRQMAVITNQESPFRVDPRNINDDQAYASASNDNADPYSTLTSAINQRKFEDLFQ